MIFSRRENYTVPYTTDKYSNTHNYGHDKIIGLRKRQWTLSNLANATHNEQPKQYQNGPFITVIGNRFLY